MVYISAPTSKHGVSRYFGNGHNGIDYMFPLNTPVYAAADGTVAAEGYGNDFNDGYDGWMTARGGADSGIYVLLKHADMFTGYAHLSRTVVNKGQVVRKGDLIGYSGTTGTSTGPHLHFEVIDIPQNWNNGYAARINPAPFIQNTATADEVRQAYLDILERPADQGGIDTYTKHTLDFVRADLRSSDEYRRLQAAKIAAANEKARLAEEERLRAEAAAKAEQERLATEEAARIEAVRKAAEEAAKAKQSYTEEDRARDIETNNILKQLWAAIKKIFNL